MQKLFLFRPQRTIRELTQNVTKHNAFRAVWCEFVDRVFRLNQRKAVLSYYHNTSASKKRNTPAPIRTQNAFGR